MKKIVFLVIDGLPDEKIPELGNRTPLEAASRKNLDHLAQKSLCGFFKPLFLGKLPDSEEVHLALFGYDPRKYLAGSPAEASAKVGRGVLEALGIGFKLLPKDIVLRGNLATINEKNEVLDRRAGRIESAQAKKVIECLSETVIEKIRFIVKPIYGHRLAIIMRGRGLSEKISDTDDKKIRRKREARPLKKGRTAEFTARVLNRFLEQARLKLSRHPLNQKRIEEGQPPANFILTRSAGQLKKVPPFREKWGLKAACVSNGALYKGVAKFLGMDLIKENGQNYLSSAYLKEKFLTVKRILPDYDFVFCHIKGADLLAEEGRAEKKKEFIESIDKNLEILENLESTLLVVTSDHATSSLKRQHDIFPVPILIYPGRGARKNQKFTEKDCLKGNLGKVNNLSIMPVVLKLAKTTK